MTGVSTDGGGRGRDDDGVAGGVRRVCTVHPDHTLLGGVTIRRVLGARGGDRDAVHVDDCPRTRLRRPRSARQLDGQPTALPVLYQSRYDSRPPPPDLFTKYLLKILS